MNLHETFYLLGMQLHLDPESLIRYAAEDPIGGYHIDEAKRSWSPGSIWEVEGKTLYALIRALKPENVVELGSWEGCSTTHLATALSVNGSGHLTAVDIDAKAGSHFPPNLKAIRTVVTGDAIAWLAAQPDASIDFLFEDTSHTPDMCAAIATLCQTKLAPGAVLVMHDAGHDFAYVGDNQTISSTLGAEVRSGIERAMGSNYRMYLAEPSDCGLAVMVPNPAQAGIDKHSEPIHPALAQAIQQVKASDPAATSEWGKVSLPVDTPDEEVEREARLTANFESMTKAELEAFAKAHDIDLTGARTKAEYIDRINVRDEPTED